MGNRNAKLADKIMNLKKRRTAVILAHNYQLGEVQDIADFVGGSLEFRQNADLLSSSTTGTSTGSDLGG